MLAAQLLAAELNLAKGVASACVSTTMTEANGLLSAASYNGPNTTTPPAKAQKDRRHDSDDAARRVQ